MFTIENNTDNLILLTLDPELEDPYYLFVMQSIYKCEPDNLILIPSYECDSTRQFNINHEFSHAGYYTVRVYEQESYTNTDPDLTAGMLYETIFNVNVVPDCP